MPQRSLIASLAAALGAGALLLLLIGVGGIHARLLSPFEGFRIAAPGGLLLGILALLLGGLGVLRTRRSTGLAGRSRALQGLATGGLAVAALLGPALGSGGAPPIHDVTTSIEDPPVFSAAVRDAPGRVNGVLYPDGGETVPPQQREAFPDLETLELAAAPDQVFDRARQAADSLGWTITSADRGSGVIEAHDVTPVFRFVDDVVIRIRPGPGGSLVDVRSNSRVGGGDLGANAARIRALRDLLRASPRGGAA